MSDKERSSGAMNRDAGDMEEVCICETVPSVETIEVEQVLGAEMNQKVVEFDMFVPAQKPDIEQVIDVYVKHLEVKAIDVIQDKVVVRASFELKVMYVADLPGQPVHAFERYDIRFTRDIVVKGAEPNMDATADVALEFIDYCFDRHEPRKVHITTVFKVWTRVVSTTNIEVVTTELLEVEADKAMVNTSIASASVFNAETTSATELGTSNVVSIGSGNINTGDTTMVVVPMTPTAGTSMVMNGKGTVTGNVVNIRNGPGTNFPIIAKVSMGTVVTMKEQAFGWYRVALSDGTVGWIAGWLLNMNS